mmetsp:Transcript_148046/g.475392  ORF Transcript_148046/g.475392 Transcript_148046/m.475392 type:complete len:1112 (-) Transcript_148046:9-3344(-)
MAVGALAVARRGAAAPQPSLCRGAAFRRPPQQPRTPHSAAALVGVAPSARNCMAQGTSTSSSSSSSARPLPPPASIFERIPKPPAVIRPPEEDAMDLFKALASPSDVPLQFVHAARANIKETRTWEMLSASAVRSLRYLRMNEVAAILHSCAQVSWRDEHLLTGLSEAMRCGADLRRGTVRDYALACQSLRRLGFCPWDGALRPIVTEMRFRLRRQFWRPVDLVFVLRFVAEFGLQRLGGPLPQGGMLCRELQERAERRLGDMRHLELAHFARALAQLDAGGGLPDFALLERVAENFSRRAENLPLGALLHLTSTLLHAHGVSRSSRVPAPPKFLRLFTRKAQEDLAQLRPFEVVVLANAAARLGLQDVMFLKQLSRAVGANLDAFSVSQVASVAQAFDLMNFKQPALLGCVERMISEADAGAQSMDKAGSPPRRKPLAPADRNRMLATLLNAAARGTARPGAEVAAEFWAEELTAALETLAARRAASATAPRMTVTASAAPAATASWLHPQSSAARRHMARGPRPPPPVQHRSFKRHRRGKKVASPELDPEVARNGVWVATSHEAEVPWSPADLGAQLAALEEIAGSLSWGAAPRDAGEALEEEPPTRDPGFSGVGALSSGKTRRSKRGGVLEVPSYAPAGSTVVRANALVENFGPRKLGATHPAARRISRRLMRLEKDLDLGKPQGPLRESPAYTGLSPKSRRSLNAPTTRGQAAIIWRRLRRYRLSGFLAEQCGGRFVPVRPEVLPLRPRVDMTAGSASDIGEGKAGGGGAWLQLTGGLDLDQAALLAEALAAAPAEGRRAPQLAAGRGLLRGLAEHCAGVAEADAAGRADLEEAGGAAAFAAAGRRRRALAALIRVGAAVADAGLDCEALRRQLEALASGSAVSASSATFVAPTNEPLAVSATTSAAGTSAATSASASGRRSDDRSLGRALLVATRLASAGVGQGEEERKEAVRRLSPLLDTLLREPAAPSSGRRPAQLWELSLRDVVPILGTIASLAARPERLDPRIRSQLLHGLEARLAAEGALGGPSPIDGFTLSSSATPPSAATLAELAAAWAWLGQEECPRPHVGGELLLELPEATVEACRRWAISPTRVRSVVERWLASGG